MEGGEFYGQRLTITTSSPAFAGASPGSNALHKRNPGQGPGSNEPHKRNPGQVPGSDAPFFNPGQGPGSNAPHKRNPGQAPALTYPSLTWGKRFSLARLMST